MKKLLIVLFVFIGISSNAQQVNLDSLNQIWLDETQPDSARFKAMNRIIWDGYIYTNTDTAFVMAEQIKKLAQEKQNKKWEANAFHIQGSGFYLNGSLAEAIKYFTNSLKIKKEIKDNKGIASLLNNIGLIYNAQGKAAEALEYYTSSLKIKEEIGDKKGISASLFNIGIFYKNQGKTSEALDFYNRSLKIDEEIGFKEGVATNLLSIGLVYYGQGKIEEALDNYARSLKIGEERIDKRGVAYTLNNIGLIYDDQGNTKDALDYYTRSLQTSKEIGDKKGIAIALNNIGRLYKKKGKNKEALDYSLKSLSISKEIGSPFQIEKAAATLKEIYKLQNKGMQAIYMLELEIQMRDSIQSEEVAKQIAQAESRAEFEKELLIQEQQEKEAARLEAEKVSRRNTIQYSGIGLGIFALFGLVFLFGKIKLPNWAVELSVFLPFLILFEFLLVITDPYVDSWSGGEPLIKLGLNVLMAALIFPAHSYLESFLKGRLFK
ncbi:MAG: tetratricopeptide repeat protein [Salibacteraceae bacterium]